MVTVLAQILTRWLLPEPLFFTEELSRYFFIWMVFLGFSYTLKCREDLRLDIISKHYGEKMNNVFNLVVDVITLAVFIFVAYWGFKYVDFIKMNMAPALQISLGIVYSVTPVSMVLCIIRVAVLVVEDVRRFRCGGKDAMS